MPAGFHAKFRRKYLILIGFAKIVEDYMQKSNLKKKLFEKQLQCRIIPLFQKFNM